MNRDFTYRIWWNLMLITIGAFLCGAALEGIVVHHGFISGGVFGTALLIQYKLGWGTAGMWFVVLNLPLFALSWLFVSRRFFLYSLYAMLACTAFFEVLHVDFGIHNELYAAIAAGVLSGFGGGMILRSLGSGGGLDVVAVILNRRYNIGVGKTYFAFNVLLFAASLASIQVDKVIASLILVFITGITVEYTLSMFNQRKVVFIVSDASDAIAARIMKSMRLGATYLNGKGAYSGNEKNVLMTVINNIQLKKLEETVFTEDENALFIVENTFSVVGSSFSRRKIY